MNKHNVEIEKTIREWFTQVKKKLVDLDDEPTIDSYVRSICAILYNHHMATTSLMRRGRQLPTMALLRTMTELVAKFIWCFHDTTDYGEVNHRFSRWAKTTCKNRIRLLSEFLESNRISDERRSAFEGDIQQLKGELASFPNSVKCVPGMTGKGGLFDQLSAVFDGNISASSYSQFCQAIHIDTSVLARCIQKDGPLLVYTGDLSFSIDDLYSHCLSNAYMLVKVLHVFYKWDPDLIDKEYFRIVPRRGNGEDGTALKRVQ